MDDSEDLLIPRLYQLQLEEVAVSKNSIIYLPTGSGKTLIAIRLIKRLRHTLQKPWGEGGKRCFFLVNNVPLVTQQKNMIEQLCPVSGVGGYSSEDNVDFWDKTKWDSELSKYQAARDWTIMMDTYEKQYKIPEDIVVSSSRPDIFLYSRQLKRVILVELTVPWETNIPKDHTFKVIVMTCQILSDMLTHQYIHLKDISLLIFDECHHGVEDHPMRLTMKHFQNCPKHQQPRVLGLTATLLNSSVKLSKVPETLRDLETTFQATIATADSIGEVTMFSTNPKEFVWYYSQPEPSEAALEATNLLKVLKEIVLKFELPGDVKLHDLKLAHNQRDISTDPKKIVKAVSKIIESMITTLSEMGVFAGALGVLANIVALERRKRWAVSEQEELLYGVAITHAVEVRAVLLESMKKHTGYEKILYHSSERIKQLLNILKEYNPEYISSNEAALKINQEKNPLSGLIITQQRFTAKILYNILKEVIEVNPKDFGFLKHDFIVGFNVSPNSISREQYYNKKMSEQRLLRFKNGELNCLVSTAVVEEGLDVPQCALVLRYDAPLEYRSYIQSKGRARSKTASFVILVNKANKIKFQSQYKEYQTVEQYLQRILYGDRDRNCPSEYEVQRNLYDDDEIPPYITKNGVCLLATSAVSLVSRYCGQLPHDQFTTLQPAVLQESVMVAPGDLRYVVTFIMPLASPVKGPTRGQAYNSTKSAKRSAALNVCIRLHEAGELDDMTLLPKPRGNIDFDNAEVSQCFPNWREEKILGEDEPRPGTKKRVRKHPVYYPRCLGGAPPGAVFHVHAVVARASFPAAAGRERALHGLLSAAGGYGLVSARALPPLPAFPVFLSAGELRAHLAVNCAKVRLDRERFDLVKRFHFFIFDQVLEVAKKFLVFNGEVNNLFVVPLKQNNSFDIDWEVMRTYREIPPCTELTLQERTSLHVTKETYNNCVVTPWYRGTLHPDRYIVSNVLEYLTPYSKFDDDSFDTYADYYVNKYNLEIKGDKQQPLLEVCNISSRMNCLLPRAATIDAFTDKQRRLASQAQGDDKPRAFRELFVPEFCVKYDFPGRLWYVATVLPSILHRVTMLLVADELRAQIATEMNLGRPHLIEGESWLPLEVDLAVAKKSLLSNLEEPPPINSIDRINNPADDSVHKPLNIMSLKESVYQIQKKKISKNYPWDESKEPIDIDRDLSHIKLMDIECYDKFVTAPMFSVESLSLVRSPQRPPAPAAAAILPPPLKYDASIALLRLGRGAPSGPAGPQPRALLAALTMVGAHDTCDLERAETLGDSFLKFAAGLYLFHKFPTMNEGELTNIKGRLIGNRNLCYAGSVARLAGRMKVEQFSPRSDFQLPAFLAPEPLAAFIAERRIRPTFLIGLQFSREEALSGELSAETRERLHEKMRDSDLAEEEPEGGAQNAMQRYVKSQAVSDKSVADCVEALVGTYLLSGGIPHAVKVLEWLKVLPPQDNFITFLHKRVSTVITEGKATEKEVEFLLNHCRPDIEKIIGYKFKDPSLLLEAFSHGSYIRNNYTRSYERLEFLGDAILDFLITAHIFEKCGKLSPGELTDLRSALVNNVTFAAYVVKLGLHKFFCSQFNGSLENAIKNFVEHQQQREHEVSEDVLYLIDEQDCSIAQYIDVPKVLSDIFESLTGALYLDCGGDLEQVWSVIYEIMHKEIDAFSMCVPKQPVRVLMERIHACPSFGKSKVTTSAVPLVMMPVSFTRAGQRQTVYGVGNNTAAAKRAAAKLALKILAA